MNPPELRLGIVGFGVGGMKFHAPYAQAAAGVRLTGIVTRDPARARLAAEQYPGVQVFASLADMARSGTVDAVTLTTPPQTRRALVLEALAAGLHVIADKPFAPDAAAARELVEAARVADRRLGVFHNRRWDANMLALRPVLASGALGTVRRFHSWFDLDEPSTVEAGPTGGLLRDLGSHLVDQALWLFGPVQRVFARLDWTDTPDGRTDVGFVLTLEHRNGVDSHLGASKLYRAQERGLRVYGDRGSHCVSHPDAPGDYTPYYEAFARAVREGGPLPVSGAEAVSVLEVLDAARESDARHAVIGL